MGLVGGVGAGQALAGAVQVAAPHGRQDLLVDHAPEVGGGGGGLVDQHVAHVRVDRRFRPVIAAAAVILAQFASLSVAACTVSEWATSLVATRAFFERSGSGSREEKCVKTED